MSGVFYSDISDHFPIFNFTSTTSLKHQEMEKLSKFRVFNSRNIERFGELIGDVSLDNVYTHDNAELAYRSFVTSFNSVFNRSFPLVSMHTKKSGKFAKPWFTSDFHRSALIKNRLYKKFIRNPLPLNAANNKNKIDMNKNKNNKKYRNKYNHLIKTAKKEHFSLKFDEASGNAKTHWGGHQSAPQQEKNFSHSSLPFN